MGIMEKMVYFQGLKLDIQALDIGVALLGYLVFHFMVHRKVKGPPLWPVLGTLPYLIVHINDFYDWITLLLTKYGGTVVLKGIIASNLTCLVTADPANVEHVLKLRFANFPKGGYFRSLAHDFLGEGIFNADDQTWRWQRRTANIEFNTASFRAFMVRSVQDLAQGRLVTVLEDAARTGKAVDLQDVLLRFTFDNVCTVALGVDPGCLGGHPDPDARAFARAFEDATEVTMMRFLIPTVLWRLMRALDLGPERKLRESLATVDRFVDGAIATRTPGSGHPDLLSAFMRMETESGQREFNDRMLRDISVNFILAGRDTSSVALSWFFWLLTRHPEVEDRILAEIRSILSKRCSTADTITVSSLDFSVEELKQMQFLQAALSESLRLYPSVPLDHKEVESDDCFPDGTFLKKGTKVIYSIYSMGRLESIWGKDCLEFRPERWLDKGGCFVNENAYRYPVFNGGPRLCLGKDFAYYQMKWIAATVLWGFRVKMVAGHVVEPKLALTLYMKNGLLVTLHPRDHCLS